MGFCFGGGLVNRLAVRMPAWVHSDHLTGLALAAMLGVSLLSGCGPQTATPQPTPTITATQNTGPKRLSISSAYFPSGRSGFSNTVSSKLAEE